MKYLEIILLFVFILLAVSFQIDKTRPEIIDLIVYDQLLIQFSEPMDSTVLDPKNYRIINVDVGILTQREKPPQVDSIYFINDSTVICLTALHNFGGFKVVIDSVYDIAGNLINNKNFAYYVNY